MSKVKYALEDVFAWTKKNVVLIIAIFIILGFTSSYGIIQNLQNTSVTGQVLDSESNPIFAARVFLSGTDQEGLVFTDEQGYFTISNINQNQILRLTVKYAEKSPAEITYSPQDIEAQRVITAILYKISNIEGKILSDTGVPLGGAEVLLSIANQEFYARAQTDGSFGFADIPFGTGMLSYAFGTITDQKPIILQREESIKDLELLLSSVKTATTIDSIPAGAAVFLDGIEVGTTPFDEDTGVGPHTLRLELSGYEIFEADLDIEPNTDNSFTFELVEGQTPTPEPSVSAEPTPTAEPTAEPTPDPEGEYYLIVDISDKRTYVYLGNGAAKQGTLVDTLLSSTAGPNYGQTPIRTWTIGDKILDPTIRFDGKVYPPGPDNPNGQIYLRLLVDGAVSNYGLHGAARENQDIIGVEDFNFGGVSYTNEDIQWMYDNLPEGTYVYTQP